MEKQKLLLEMKIKKNKVWGQVKLNIVRRKVELKCPAENIPDEIIVDLNKNEINCTQLTDTQTFKDRKEAWEQVTKDNGGNHPFIGDADTRLLNRMRSSAVSAIYGAGMHPNRHLWVPNPREIINSGFVPKNIHRS